jgi:hypothetical protein
MSLIFSGMPFFRKVPVMMDFFHTSGYLRQRDRKKTRVRVSYKYDPDARETIYSGPLSGSVSRFSDPVSGFGARECPPQEKILFKLIIS